MPHGSKVAALLASLAALTATERANAAPAPTPYRGGDPGGFRNILPPGSNGNANALQLGAFLAGGARPPHNDDQLKPYGDLVYEVPGLEARDLDRFFKDGSFGVKPGDVERTYSPGGRDDVVVQRDRFGVPHVTGSTREGALFAIGYTTGEDRMFFIDVLRHVGRAQLSSFAGGAEGNRAMDREIWQSAPYTEEELARQIDPAYLRRVVARKPELAVTEEEITATRAELDAYTAGINRFIAEAKMDPTKLPGEYAAINRPQGPDPWVPEDTVAIATLVGGIFGKGGGSELGSALVRQAFHVRFGERKGERLWRGFRAADDPEAVSTEKRRFRGPTVPRRPEGIAVPDRGSTVFADVVRAPGGVRPAGQRDGVLPGGRAASGAVATGVAQAMRVWRAAREKARTGGGTLGGLGFPSSASNALLVGAQESASGRPLAVFGPQVSYFSPQILVEHSVVAPGYRARGVSFPGTNLFVQLGRGQDYAWSATSAGNDVVDTVAVELCAAPGDGYRFRGTCRPFERLERTNSWQPTAGDMTPAGTEKLVTLRTVYGPVVARATLKGKPIAYVSQRTTYFHEPESIIGFRRINNPDYTTGPARFQRAFHGVQFTFNWFYADTKQTAYFNSGALPVRGRRVHPDFPVLVGPSTELRGFDPDLRDVAVQAFAAHPRSVDQPVYANWNNKQAKGYRADDGRYNFSAVDRGELLRDRLAALTKGARKTTLLEMTEAMEDAGTVDLRGRYVLPFALDVIGRPADPRAARAVATLREWVASGAHRRDTDRDGRYEHAEAVRLMDAWWPRWVRAQLTPVLGDRLAEQITNYVGLGDMPHIHQGSAFDDGIWGQVEKDLRTVLGRRVRGKLSRKLCGDGVLRRCRADLTTTLIEAAAVPASELYRDPDCADGNQLCYDEVRHTPTGGITQPGIHWINRPTFQQLVEVEGRRP
jgi:acyl-homoserine lactone acylase PvdQ